MLVIMRMWDLRDTCLRHRHRANAARCVRVVHSVTALEAGKHDSSLTVHCVRARARPKIERGALRYSGSLSQFLRL